MMVRLNDEVYHSMWTELDQMSCIEWNSTCVY